MLQTGLKLTRKGTTMNKKIIRIPKIWSHFCILTLREELCKLEGVQDVKVDISTKQARVLWDAPATWEQISTTLKDINYSPEEG